MITCVIKWTCFVTKHISTTKVVSSWRGDPKKGNYSSVSLMKGFLHTLWQILSIASTVNRFSKFAFSTTSLTAVGSKWKMMPDERVGATFEKCYWVCNEIPLRNSLHSREEGEGETQVPSPRGKPSANTPFVFQKELNFNLSSSFLKCAPHVSLLEDKAIAVKYQLSTIDSGNFKTILSRNLFCGSSVFCLVKISEPKIRRTWPPRVSAAFWGAFPGRIGEQWTADNVHGSRSSRLTLASHTTAPWIDLGGWHCSIWVGGRT